jgi:hypothetical protein
VINPELVRVTGPLSPFREGFGTWLETAGWPSTRGITTVIGRTSRGNNDLPYTSPVSRSI